MNYEKIYSDLVEKAKVRGLDKSQHEGYYELYLTSVNLTAAKFTTLYNKIHCDEVSANTFSSMHREFINGWVPLEDKEWLLFSKGN